MSNYTNITFFIIHLVGLIDDFSINIGVLVVVEVLDVLTVDSIIYSFIFIVVITIPTIVGYSCMIWLHVL